MRLEGIHGHRRHGQVVWWDGMMLAEQKVDVRRLNVECCAFSDRWISIKAIEVTTGVPDFVGYSPGSAEVVDFLLAVVMAGSYYTRPKLRLLASQTVLVPLSTSHPRFTWQPSGHTSSSFGPSLHLATGNLQVAQGFISWFTSSPGNAQIAQGSSLGPSLHQATGNLAQGPSLGIS